MAYTRDQMETGQLLWLLTLTLRGQRYRYATVTVRVPSGVEVLSYELGLSPIEFEDRAPAPGEGIVEPGAELEIVFSTDAAEGWATLAAGDADLGDAEGELALWLQGEDFSTREIVLSGPVHATGYGALSEPVQITLTERPWRAAPGSWPPDSERVSDSTWPRSSMGAWRVAESAQGERYPEICGAPGYSAPSSPANSYAGSPGLLVEIRGTTNVTYDWTLLIGRGRLRCAGVSGSVLVRNVTSGLSATVTPTVIADELGQEVTVAVLANATLAVAEGDELWVSFLYPRSAGRASSHEIDAAGIVGGAATRTMRQAGEILEWLLQLSGARLDAARLTEARAWLAGYRLDFWLNEPVDPIDFALDEILPLLPVSLRVTRAGLALTAWRWNATASQAVAHFDAAKEGARREGRVSRSEAEKVLNHLGIEYAVNGETGKPGGRIAVIPSQRYSDSQRERHPYALASATRYGEREASPIQTALVVDGATARAVLDWRLSWDSQTRETVRYLAPQAWQFLEPGDVVRVSDVEIGWSERVCLLAARVRAEGPTLLEFTTVPNWVRDGR